MTSNTTDDMAAAAFVVLPYVEVPADVSEITIDPFTQFVVVNSLFDDVTVILPAIDSDADGFTQNIRIVYQSSRPGRRLFIEVADGSGDVIALETDMDSVKIHSVNSNPISIAPLIVLSTLGTVTTWNTIETVGAWLDN